MKQNSKNDFVNKETNLNQMQFEISNGTDHHGRTMCDVCGSVGGTITRKLVELGEKELQNKNHFQ